MTRLKWIIVVVALLAAAGPVGAWVYFNVISDDPPERLSLSQEKSVGADATVTDINGTWKPGPGTQVGYRVDEIAFGQSQTAAGRTDKVTGTMVISGATVSSVDLSVDMRSVTSDESRRDGQFRGRIMSVDQFPTARFVLTSPIELPATTGTVNVKATGKLTLRGTTKDVTVDLKAQRGASSISVNGAIPIVFAEWSIPNPGNEFINTEDHGELEFLVVFVKA